MTDETPPAQTNGPVDPIGYTYREDARLGGTDVVISLSPEQAAALGADAGMLADWLHTAMTAIARLRTTGTGTAQEWGETVNAIDVRLMPRLEGVRDAAVRAHTDAGGSHGALGYAMGVPRSTAQSRRKLLELTAPSEWEEWARSGGPQAR